MPFESLNAVFYSPSIVSVAVCEIFSVIERCDLENRVRVRSKSLEMAPFDRPHTSSYSPFIVHSNYGAILYRLRNIATYWKKIAKFLYPTCIDRPCWEWFRRNFVKMSNADKTRVIGLPYGEKNYDNMLSRFRLIPERHGQTDGRTDGQAERQNCYINVVSIQGIEKRMPQKRQKLSQQYILYYVLLIFIQYATNIRFIFRNSDTPLNTNTIWDLLKVERDRSRSLAS